MITGTDSTPEMLTLGRIAHWYAGTTLNQKTKEQIENITTNITRASVPILQRGLVWKPQQIEMLWDSLLRGFPVGALVLCPKIKGQVKETDSDATHHILDGQQRCNAISLGFIDPFPQYLQSKQEISVSSILWLDLNPQLHDGSTRDYLPRLTTLPHPWGYWTSDNSDRLSASDIRKALEQAGKPASQQGYKRPEPRDMSPYFSNAPVPLAWLMSAPITDSEVFWKHVKDRLETLKYPWTIKSLVFIDNEQNAKRKQHIYDGIVRAHNATIVALMAPKGLLDETSQEAHDNGVEVAQNRSDISNIEHLFQRLNRQGTQLDGEELAYSMIKAYWPELAKPVDEIRPRHMPSSRMVALAVRVALASDAKHLPSALGVSQIRALAKKKDQKILELIIGANSSVENSPLFDANAQVDKWLRYSPGKNESGFLPLQITRFAMSSPDVYLLLIWIAHSTRNDPVLQDNLLKPVQAVTSWMHWFANDKGKAVNCIYAQCNMDNSFSIDVFKKSIRIAMQKENSFVAAIPNKDDLAAFIKYPESDIDNWNWGILAKDRQGQEVESRKQLLEQAIYRIISNKEILLYAQRRYLNSQFENYDPSDKDMWLDYNCPWDYDHILAHSYVHNKRSRDYQKFSSKWINTIGNFRAWPFEGNRSDQCDLAKDKIITDEDRINSFLLRDSDDAKDIEEQELQVFSSGQTVNDHHVSTLRFAKTCWERTVRIYGEWYDSVGIADLQPHNPNSESIVTPA